MIAANKCDILDNALLRCVPKRVINAEANELKARIFGLQARLNTIPQVRRTPEFSTTFLSLMEISDGTYLYAKFLSVQVHV
jgi:hypothetical protein